MTIELEGHANDGVAEAMSGGTVVIRQPAKVAPLARASASVIGNAACYGATGGRLFVEGRAGQRLGVRNSGATIVAEGAGKYAFEYMTGGVGVVLGPSGAVIGSGLTGGALWLYDEDGRTSDRLHAESVRVESHGPTELNELHELVEEHARLTKSARANELLQDWAAASKKFIRVRPVPAAPVERVEDRPVSIRPLQTAR
jgi:glutamate synthase domain-containing protein 3